MADRKNQHFVPKVLLKPWTLNAENKAINLYNIRADKGIPNASVKKQCSRDYFYGADKRIETWLGKGEGIYSEVVKPLPINDISTTASALEILRDFCLLQYLRTERSLAEDAAMLREMYDQIFHGALPDGESVPTHEEIVADAIERWRKVCPHLQDLKGVLIINESEVPFVISDDPAIHTNKLHIHRLGSANFGLQQSGMILTMPISPRLAVLFYDGGVYTVSDKNKLNLAMHANDDARAFNELQYIKANENIYFENWSQLDSIRNELREVAGRRMPTQFKLNLLVPVEGREGAFRMSEDQTANPPGESMIHLESVSFRPRLWPSQLRYRLGMQGYSDGSSAGYLRKAWAVEAGMNKKNKIKF